MSDEDIHEHRFPTFQGKPNRLKMEDILKEYSHAESCGHYAVIPKDPDKNSMFKLLNGD